MTPHLDREPSALGSVSNVASSHDIDSCSITDTVHSSDDRLGAILDGGDGILELLDVLCRELKEEIRVRFRCWNCDS